MPITMKSLADELGVSKQAVYKRVTGKLKTVLAPYTYTEYNYMCLTDEGADIVRKDFEDNPCSTPRTYSSVPNMVQSGVNTYQSGTDTENKDGTHMDKIRNADGADNPNIRNTYGVDTTQIQSVSAVYTPERSETDTQCSENVPKQIHPVSETHTEQVDNTYVQHTEEIERMRSELDTKREELHQRDLELVKAKAEKEKLEEVIKQLNERLDEKDTQIAEQKIVIEKTDNERKILTASLFRNNEFIEKLMQLSLSKRIFGWKDIKKQLMTSKNDIADDVTGETVVDDD